MESISYFNLSVSFSSSHISTCLSCSFRSFKSDSTNLSQRICKYNLRALHPRYALWILMDAYSLRLPIFLGFATSQCLKTTSWARIGSNCYNTLKVLFLLSFNLFSKYPPLSDSMLDSSNKVDLRKWSDRFWTFRILLW